MKHNEFDRISRRDHVAMGEYIADWTEIQVAKLEDHLKALICLINSEDGQNSGICAHTIGW